MTDDDGGLMFGKSTDDRKCTFLSVELVGTKAGVYLMAWLVNWDFERFDDGADSAIDLELELELDDAKFLAEFLREAIEKLENKKTA